MPDTTQTEIPNTAAAPAAAPAAGTPSAAAAPAAAAPAPRAAAPAAGGGGKQKNKGGQPGGQPFHKQAGFKDRLQREAAAMVRKNLGMTIEEAKALLARGGAPAPAAAAAPAAAPAPGARRDPDAALRTKVHEQERRIEKQKNKIKTLRTRHADEMVNQTMRQEALGVGIAADHVDFALNLYSQAVRATKEGDPPESQVFFVGLRKTRAYLFREGAPVVTLSPTTAPPEGAGPGGETATPAGAGTPPKLPDAMEMSDSEFREHKRRYGI